MITPWNWPLNQIACKVAPGARRRLHHGAEAVRGRAARRIIFAEILDEAGVPKGVFNLVNGDGPTVGAAMAAHPDIDMVSFTGSTRAGIEVAKRARRHGQARRPGARRQVAEHHPRRRRLPKAVAGGVAARASTTRGQSCNAPTRMLVPRASR